MVEVVKQCSIVVLLSVGERLFRLMGEVGHMFLVLVVRVVSSLLEWVFVLAVDATVMEGTVIEVLTIIVGVMVAVLHLVVRVVVV